MIWKYLFITMLLFCGMGALAYQGGHDQIKIDESKKIIIGISENVTKIFESNQNDDTKLPVKIMFKTAIYLVDVMTITGVEAIQYGYENPQYDYVFLVKSLIYLFIFSTLIRPVIFLGSLIVLSWIELKKKYWSKKK